MNEICCLYHVAGGQTAPKPIVVDVDDLEKVRELINCDCIDIVQRKIGTRAYNIICDDEALLKQGPIMSTFNFKTFQPDIFGNVLICSGEINGDELVSLTAEEFAELQMFSNFYVTVKDKRFSTIIVEAGD